MSSLDSSSKDSVADLAVDDFIESGSGIHSGRHLSMQTMQEDAFALKDWSKLVSWTKNASPQAPR